MQYFEIKNRIYMFAPLKETICAKGVNAIDFFFNEI